MKKTNCIICFGESFLIKSLGEISIYKCDSCQIEFANPMPTKKELDNFYHNYRDYSQYNEKMMNDTMIKNAERNINYLRKYGLGRFSMLLDVGCGNNCFVERGESKDCFTEQGDSQLWCGYDKYTQPIMGLGKFDFITLWGVLEHFVNPVEVIKDLTQRLEDHGKIVMTTVGTETGIPYRYIVPEHLTWWSRKSIEELSKKAGFNIKEMSNYYMFQNPKFYLDRVLNAGKVSKNLKKLIDIGIEVGYVYVPTNEMFIVGEKK